MPSARQVLVGALGSALAITGLSVVLPAPAAYAVGGTTLSALDVAYSQNFDTLSSTTGTSSTVPDGWAFSESLANANTLYTVGTGSGTSGDTYSFGASSASDRAFGAVQSGSLISTIGASFTNSTGGTITSLDVSFTGEQWRLGATGRADRLDFQYSLNATSLTTGTWTDGDALDFSSPVTTGTTGALDGNTAANRANVSSTLSSLAIGSGATFWIRWNDFNASGADDGLAIDSFSLTPHGVVGSPLVVTDPGAKSGVRDEAIANFTVTATGGTAPYTWGATGLPSGVTINSTTGEVSGTPISTCTCSVTVTATDSATPTAATASATFTFTVAAPTPPTAISDIQGTGDRSPFAPPTGTGAGDTKTIEGIVTALYKTGGFNGMYVQTPGTGGATDTTPGSSDAIFVFGGSNAVNIPSNIAIGDSVRVTGAVSEFAGTTEITPPNAASVIEMGSPLAAVTGLEIAYPTTEAAREAQEGMLLAPTDTFTIADVFNINNFGEIKLATGTAPLKQPTEFVDRSDTAGIQGIVDDNAARLVVLNDASTTNYLSNQTTKAIPLPWLTAGNGSVVANPPRVGAQATFNSPVILEFRNNLWNFEPRQQVTGDSTYPGSNVVSFADDRTDNLAPRDVGGDIKLATFNVQNYFFMTGEEYADSDNIVDPPQDFRCTYFTDRASNRIGNNSCGVQLLDDPDTVADESTQNSGSGPRGAATTVSRQRQEAKIVAAINAMDADIIALEEMENTIKLPGKTNRDEGLSHLVDLLNQAAGAGTWKYVKSPGEATTAAAIAEQDVIRPAFIYKPASVSPVGQSDILFGTDAFANAREPLAQAFKAVGAPNNQAFAVIGNHFKSKGDSGAQPANGDNTNDPYVGAFNGDRNRQAAKLLEFAEDFASARDIEAIFMLGDFNAYSHEDPVNTIEAGGFDLLESDQPHDYSYAFSGLMGSLDHVFANDAAQLMVTGTDVWELNANEAISFNYSRYNYNVTDFWQPNLPFATSDHNPEVIGIDLPDFTPTTTKQVQIVSTNDFHGRLLPDGGNAAGAAPFSSAVNDLRSEVPAGNTIFAAAGDLIGASTFESFVQDDEPTIDAFNAMGLEVSSAGNHEFDQGYDDFVNRVQDRADWEYIAANVNEPSGQPDKLASTWTKTIDGVDVGFVGAVTEDLPTLVNPAGMTGVTVSDIVDSTNAAAADLKAGGADIVVLLVHEGSPSTDCSSTAFTDPATVWGNIVQNTSSDVDAIISGHTHLAYNCRFPVADWASHAVTKRPVVSAGQYGTNLNQLVFNFDENTNELRSIDQEVRAAAGVGYASDPAVQPIVDAAVTYANTKGGEILGQTDGLLKRAVYNPPGAPGTENRGGESTLGNEVAEIQRWATQLPATGIEADIAFMNPGGLRKNLVATLNGGAYDVTYRDAANVQPFANTLVNMELTGAQIKTVLEQQWQRTPTGNVPSRPFLRLGVSKGFTYTYKTEPETVSIPPAAPVTTTKGTVTGMWLNGVPIDPAATYSVTVNSFLATGGDNFHELAHGSDVVDTGKVDLQAMVDYLAQYKSPAAPLAVDYSQRAVEVAFPSGAPASYSPGDTVTFDVASWTMSNTSDTKDTELQVKYDGNVIGTATVDNTLTNKPYDTAGTAHVSVTLPANTKKGQQQLRLVGASTGTNVPVVITVTRPTTDIQIIGTNDFHGRLLPDGLPSTSDCNTAGVGCPGALLSGAVKSLRASNPNTVFAAAGDLIGASTFESFIQKDKPTIDALNEAGLEVSSVGNHEFDQGYNDLVDRVMAPYDATTNPYGGANWEYLAANVEEPAGQPDKLASTWTKTMNGVKVGFVGAVTEELPTLVSPAGLAGQGVTVTDIVDATNAAAADLKADGADVVVLLVHEGSPSTNCASAAFTDPATVWGNITQNVSADVDAIISGHTHLAYNCSFPVQAWVDGGRPVTERPVVSSGQYGQNINKLVLTVDTGNGEVEAKTQSIVALNESNFTEDPAVVSITHAAKAQADVLGAQVLGQIQAPLNRAKLSNGTTENRGGESTLGNQVAEVQRWATRNPESGSAEIAFMNPGGLRQDMAGTVNGGARDVTYKQAAVVQPFANTLVNMDLTGAQIKTVLEQQWQRDASGNVPTRPFLRLGVSKGFRYTYVETPVTVNGTATFQGQITGMWLNGTPIDPAATYSVTVNAFLASGGDNFRELANGTNKADTGKVDLQAMVDYLGENAPSGSPLAIDYSQRAVEVHNVAASYTAGQHITFDVGSWTMSNSSDTKDSEITVKLGSDVLGTATLNNTIGTAVYDQYGTAHVDVPLPVATPAGPAQLTLVGADTGTEVTVKVTINEAPDVDIQIIGTNDFHGRLLPDGLPSTSDCNTAGVGCPGALLSGAVKSLRASNPNTVFAAAGDLIGASTFESFIQKDKPTIDALNEAGLEVSSVGNHEFDQGYSDLVDRVMAPYDASTNPYGGANWEYLAANIDEPSGRDELAPSWTKTMGGIKVGFVGAVTEDLPSLVSPAGMTGVTVTDIVDATNAAAADLKADGADVVVLLVHEGSPTTNCASTAFTDPATVWGNITQNVSADVDAIISGHTHLAYNCSFPVQAWVDGGRAVTQRPVVSAGQYGQNIDKLVFTVDPVTGDVVAKSQSLIALNETNFTEDPAVVSITHAAKAQADVLGAQVLGQIQAPFNRAKSSDNSENRGGESTLGNLVAEVQRWATASAESGSAEIAFMNPGGLRQDMAGTVNGGARDVTYKQAAVVQPFANTLVNMDLTGAQIKTVLEQQWQRDASGNVPTRPFLRLGVSKGFKYTYVETPVTVNGTATFQGQVTGMWLNGTPIDPAATYSVTVNSFLASGGDNFRELANGTHKADTGKVDLQAMVDYLGANAPSGSPLAVDYSQRAVEVHNVASSYDIGSNVTFDVSSWTMSTADDVKDSAITVKLGTTELGTATLNNTIGSAKYDQFGTAHVSVALPAGTPVGIQNLTLEGASTGTQVTVPIEVHRATTTVEGHDATQTYGKAASMQVDVTAPGVVPTGTVTLRSAGVYLGSGTLGGSGSASVTIPAKKLAVGDHTVTITYPGDGSVKPGTDTATLTVVKATPTIVRSRTVIEYGETASIPVKVSASGVVPTGTVTLSVAGTEIGTGTLSGGSVNVSVAAKSLPAQTAAYSVDVAYSGDGFVDSGTNTVVLVVSKATPTVTGEDVTMNAGGLGHMHVTVSTATDVVPTGKVVLLYNGATIGAATLTDGAADVTILRNKLPGSATPYDVTVKYNGDGSVKQGTDTVQVTVNP